jgi:hypothetical protein
MASITFDLSGRNGLASRHQGDTNQNETPNRRYLAGDGQMVSGIWNPLKKYGYMSPANADLTQITGITGRVVSSVYDSVNDDVYVATNDGEYVSKIYKIDGLGGTTGATQIPYMPLNYKITQLIIYEIAGARVLLYSYLRKAYNEHNIGFIALDDNSGIREFNINPVSTGNFTESYFITDGTTKRFAQRFVLQNSGFVRGVMLRCASDTVDYDFPFRVGIQTDSDTDPSGTWVAYKDLTSAETLASTGQSSVGELYVVFDPPVLMGLGKHWVVFETSASSGNSFSWQRTDGGTGVSLYNMTRARKYESGTWSNADTSTQEVFGFSILFDYITNWYPLRLANNTYLQHKTKYSAFITLADNGLAYVFNDNFVDVIDGKKTGGNIGLLTEQVLEFSSYMYCVDAVDTNGLLYIGLNSNTSSVSAPDDKTFSQNHCGVYVWDKISAYQQVRDFVPIQGIREIRRMGLSKNGDVLLWCTSNTGVGELRKLQNGRAMVVALFEEEGYPTYKHSQDYYENMVVWLGNNGILYGYGQVEIGEQERLFKLADFSSGVTEFNGGIILAGNSTTPQKEGVYVSYSSSTTDYFAKWIPNKENVTALQGNVYTPVQFLPRNSRIDEINIYSLPTTTDNTTVIANVKIYLNQSSTPTTTASITNHDSKVGMRTVRGGYQNVNALQLEIEWVGNTGTSEYTPAVATIQYTATDTPAR